jgi:hypothetical protein
MALRKFDVRWWMRDNDFVAWKLLINFDMAYRPSWEYEEMMDEVRRAPEFILKVVGL